MKRYRPEQIVAKLRQAHVAKPPDEALAQERQEDGKSEFGNPSSV
jgi:hypothetical protein